MSNRRIRRLDFTHDSKAEVAEVGDVFEPVGEEVETILDAGDMYLVCTRTRGVLGGLPLRVGKPEARNVEDFD